MGWFLLARLTEAQHTGTVLTGNGLELTKKLHMGFDDFFFLIFIAKVESKQSENEI